MNEPKSLQDLKIDDAEFAVLKGRLSAEKKSLEGQLAELNAQASVKLLSPDYHRNRSIRGTIVKQLMEKECEIAEVNSRRREVNTVIDVRKHQQLSPSGIRHLVEIRDRWHDFSMNPDNHKKARDTAWKISQELRTVLKSFFDGGKTE